MSEHIKHLDQIHEIVAGDKCFLKEIFHPDKDDIDIGYSLASAYIHAGGKTLNHFLDQSETYYIISGKGRMHIDDHSFDVKAGSSYYVPPKSHQWLENTGDSKIEFLVIVDPPWRKKGEVILSKD
ncbi:MAG: cupin domain-containing protein [Bacteroidetes bacterium]|nr:cupin domain-containing protein [Bacteroidota bacterium]